MKFGLKPFTPSIQTGVTEHAARGAGIGPLSVGQARRKLSGHEPGTPKKASRLAPQHSTPRTVVTQVNMSPAFTTDIPGTAGPVTGLCAQATVCPSTRHLSGAGPPSWPASPRPQQVTCAPWPIP